MEVVVEVKWRCGSGGDSGGDIGGVVVEVVVEVW